MTSAQPSTARCSSFLILLIAAIGMLPALIATGGYYVHGDITSQMLPYVYETKRMLASGAPLWSWNTYFGDNFIGSYAYYTVFNPFTWINCLFPYEYLGLGFTLMLYLKFLVCGYVVISYLRKMGFGMGLSTAGCLLYTFSSWAVTNLYYYMFVEPMILFPLLLIFVERFLRGERHGCSGLALVTFAVVAVNYYFASVNLIAGAMYFLFRLCDLHADLRIRASLTARAAGCVALGVGCAAVVIVPVLMHLDGGSDKTLYFNYKNFRGMFDRTFWLVYPKLNEGETFHLILVSGYRSNSASVAVFGLLPAMLLFRTRGYGWIKWLTAAMVAIYATPLNGVFSLFTEGDYTRWGYALTLMIILCSLYYIKGHGMPGVRAAICYSAATTGFYLLLTAASVYWQWSSFAADRAQWTAYFAGGVALVVTNAAALIIVSRHSGALIPVVAVCSAMQLLCSTLYQIKPAASDKTPMTERLYFIHGDNFRTDSTFSHRTHFLTLHHREWYGYNFGLICNRPSIESFHSIQNQMMHLWRYIVGEKSSRVLRPLKHVDSFGALMSVRDLVVAMNEPADTCVSDMIPTGGSGRFTIYPNTLYIPMGFAYDRYVLTDDVETLMDADTEADIPRILLGTLSVEREDVDALDDYLRRGTIDADASLDSLVARRRAVACDRFEGHSRGFDAHINVDSACVVFFSVLADKGFTAFVDGEETRIFRTNLGFSSVVVPAGSHNISFRYSPPGLPGGALISAIAFLAVGLVFIHNDSRRKKPAAMAP